jgi:hypothetical protein
MTSHYTRKSLCFCKKVTIIHVNLSVFVKESPLYM